MNKKPITCMLILAAALALSPSARADISSVTLTPAAPTTLSNGKSYYVAGKQYTFRVQAVDPEATQDDDWNQITLRFRTASGVNTEAECVITINAAGTDTVTSQTNVVVDTVDRTNTAFWSNLDYRITLRFRWDIPAGDEFNASATNDVFAQVSEDLLLPPLNLATTGTDIRTMSYGVCASIRVLNFAQDGVAADGRINPWHTGFNVTGAIVYYVAGESITDKVQTIDAGEITGTTLLMDGGAAPSYTNNTVAGDLSYALDTGTGVLALGDHAWRVRAAMNTGGTNEDSVVANQLGFNCDQVEVTAVTFTGGGGINAPYYRSVNIAGTQINVTARMQNGLGPMVGNTIIRFSDGTNNYNVPILDGANTGSLLLNPYPGVGITPDTQTTPLTYSAILVSGGAYDNEQAGAGNITQPAGPLQIYWDRNDPPGNNVAPFTGWVSASPIPSGFRLSWTPLTALADPPYDDDFYTYRIYYRKTQAVPMPFTMIDNTTNASLGLIGTNFYDITGLSTLTNFDYFVTAIDVFGQETPVTYGAGNTITASNATYQGAPNANFFGQVNTLPTTLEVTITDGISEYKDASFTADPLASARPMAKTAIRISLFLVAAEGQPDSLNLIVAPDDTPGPVYDLVTGTTLNGSEGVNWYRIACTKAAPNKWTGYIPDTNPLITMGSSVRFIVENIKNSVANYSDHDSDYNPAELVPPGNPNNYEWTFNISKAVTFTPWPTRVLNNVITDRNPLAYPSFYLTDDAYVTIKAYDIKGRSMATLLDNAFRKGGQNIKEGGWGGTNRSGKKLGPGLYYLNIKAKRASDGRTILNENEKVVVAR